MRKKTRRKSRQAILCLAVLCLGLIALGSVETVAAQDTEDFLLVETVFNERNGLPTGEANDVLQTSDGYIWIGSSDNHVVRLELSGERFSDDDIHMPRYTLEKASVINSMREISDGCVAVSGLHGYALVSPEEGIVREISEEGTSNVNSSTIDYQSNIWLAFT